LRENRAAGAAAQTSLGGGMDWEAQKRRILAALEAESEEEDKATPGRRVQIEEVVQTTEQALRQKEQEIADLKQLLDDQSKNIGSLAVGAASLEGILNKDALILEERENLRCLQKQWEEKLRQAEMEMSLERAKLARDRVQIEGKLRMLTSAGNEAASPADAEKAEKPVRGRWRSWLGLKDHPEE
jgi:hypothetical protein